MVNICVWVLASAFGVPAMVLGNVEVEVEQNSRWSWIYLSMLLWACVLGRTAARACEWVSVCVCPDAAMCGLASPGAYRSVRTVTCPDLKRIYNS